MSRPPLPPFTLGCTMPKVRLAEAAWNSRDAARLARACTPDSRWRNRPPFPQGRAGLDPILASKRQRADGDRNVEASWAFRDERIAVRLAHEWHDHGRRWSSSDGDQAWAVDADGPMHARIAGLTEPGP